MIIAKKKERNGPGVLFQSGHVIVLVFFGKVQVGIEIREGEYQPISFLNCLTKKEKEKPRANKSTKQKN